MFICGGLGLDLWMYHVGVVGGMAVGIIGVGHRCGMRDEGWRMLNSLFVGVWGGFVRGIYAVLSRLYNNTYRLGRMIHQCIFPGMFEGAFIKRVAFRSRASMPPRICCEDYMGFVIIFAMNKESGREMAALITHIVTCPRDRHMDRVDGK